MKLKKKFLWCLAIIFLLFGVAGISNATTIDLTLNSVGTVGGTTIYSASLTGLGLSEVASISVYDDGTTYGGADGIFSGFDLDAIFLDMDGNYATTGDQYFADEYFFTAGTTRPTSLWYMQPNATHPGPTFGSLDATTIDYATATLTTFDAVAVAHVNTADGFLTLGDGGSLGLNFDPTVVIGSTLFLVTGEVGGQAGEFVDASVYVSDEPIEPVPEPATMLLLGSGLIGLAGFGRKKFKS